MSSGRDLTTGSVGGHLSALAMPMVFGIIAVISVNLIDTFFVAKLGTSALAALTFTFPVTMVASSLGMGLAAGTASLVSRAIGAKKRNEAIRISTDSLILSVILVTAMAVIGYSTIDDVFSALGANGEILSIINQYMKIWYLAVPFLVVPVVATSIVRAVGDAFWPSMIMIGSAAVNIASTPALMFGIGPIPAFGVEGAALGTLVSWLFTFFFAIWMVVFREQLVAFNLPSLAEVFASWKNVLSVGIPAALGNAVSPVGIAIVTAIVAALGAPLVAGFGVGTRLEAFAVIPMLALSSAIGPVAGCGCSAIYENSG